MSAVTGKTPGSPGATRAGESNSPPTQGRVAAGLTATRDIITSAASTAGAKAGEWKAHGASFLYTVFVAPLSWAWGKLTGLGSWVLDKCKGKGRIPAKTIEIEVPNWTWGTTIKKVSLEYALQKHYITPAQAKEKGYCNDAYLTARGYDIVKFPYTWLGMSYNYDGKLKSALRKGYITIEEAIGQTFITKDQAIEGGFLKADKPAKETK